MLIPRGKDHLFALSLFFMFLFAGQSHKPLWESVLMTGD